MHFKTQTDRCDNKLMLHWLAGDLWMPTESKKKNCCVTTQRGKNLQKSLKVKISKS